MPRSYIKKRKQSYSDASLELAIKNVKEGKSIYMAAKEYRVPYETLRRWMVKNPSRKGSGRPTVFSFEEEKLIVESLKFMSLCGHPQDRKDLKFIVKNVAQSFPASRNIPFKKGIPGDDWLRNFEKRWSTELGKRKPELLTKARSEALTPDVVNSFFIIYEKLLKENNLTNNPERIFNLDEIGLGTDSRNCGVFVPKKSRTAYLKSPSCGKTMYTVLFCVSADGKCMPPFIVYKSRHLYNTWTRGGPPGAMYSCTDSGWMHSTVFEQWMKNFSKFVEHLEKPVLLLYDGHGSHLTYETIRHAIENQIIILCLPPHTSHALQPLDVGVFAPLKKQWKDILKTWFRESRLQMVTKAIFPFLLSKLSISEQNIIKGFKGSGIYPINRDASAHRITSDNLLTLSHPTAGPSTLNEVGQSSSIENSGAIIASPHKDLKLAILNAISPKTSDLTTNAMKNLKSKRKRVQAKTGEVLC